jgi:hypothetical protein
MMPAWYLRFKFELDLLVALVCLQCFYFFDLVFKSLVSHMPISLGFRVAYGLVYGNGFERSE